MLVTALSGGVGGSKLVLGLSKLLKHGELVVIGNTGDDFELFGLHISPDLDIVMYTLAGIVDEQKGWGIKDDTFSCLDTLNQYYGLEKWFNLGDKDLATHIYRTELLSKGHKLSEITETLCLSLGLNSAKIIPMTDDKVETTVKIQNGSTINFQEYFVKRGCKDQVKGVIYKGSRTARPAEGVVENIRNSDIIVICPSNPIASIGPILSITGVREALKKATCPVVAISPIIGGKPLKGPADKFMKGLGLEVSALGVAKFYGRLINYFLMDEADARLDEEIKLMGLDTVITNTVMNTLEDKVRLATTVLNLTAKGRDR
nr:2-phospho-L-lactate transferase [Candidatus Njordarchaeota archaeon]